MIYDERLSFILYLDIVGEFCNNGLILKGLKQSVFKTDFGTKVYTSKGFENILFEFLRQNYQLFIDVRFACIFTKLDILQDFHLLCFSRNRRRPSRKVQHKRPLPAKMKALLCMCAW